MSSSQAVNKISESKQRYNLQDRMLQGFADYPNSTAKEIGRAIGLQYEEYCDGPKRVHDLKQLGKIIITGERECNVTKKQAEFYCVADGARFVGRDKALVVPSLVVLAASPAKSAVYADRKVVKSKVRDLQNLILGE